MKAKPECILCLFKQALNTARFVTDDPKVQEQVLRKVAAEAARQTLNQTPTALSQHVYRIVSEVTGIPDPYKKQKAETDRIALRLLPELRQIIRRAKNPLDAALHAAVAGNIIDLGIGHKFDIEKDIRGLMHQPFAVSVIKDFEKELRPGRKLLYLGDNAGEIVFDTLLVQHVLGLGVEVTYTVKSGPIINDAMMTDAEFAGMTKLARVIETGSNDIGVRWQNTSREFRAAFKAADVIVAKGHGNFETCDDRPENVYFLLKAKCDVVAAALGVTMGSLVFARKSRAQESGIRNQRRAESPRDG